MLMVSVCCDLGKKHLIRFSISTDLKKVRNSVKYSKCPTVLLKATLGLTLI